MIDLAKTLGANESALSEYLSSERYQTQIDEDIAMAEANGVQGTPTFFINGEIVAGAQPFSVFEEIIEKELS
jgi:predicted DsbA family dithiol-disulfide isomerase